MIKVEYEGGDVFERFLDSFGEAGLAALTRDIAEGARAKWVDLAKDLQTTRFDYMRGIQPVKGRGTFRYIDLLGVLPNLVEQGMEPFDMRETLLREGQPGVKKNKAGERYRSIPFRHKGASAGFTGGLPMGSQYGALGPSSRAAKHTIVEDSKKLGRAIHRAAKKLGPGQRLEAGLAEKLRAHHSTDIFAGMVKRTQRTQASAGLSAQVSAAAGSGGFAGFGGGGGTSGYYTFRTISTDPDTAGKWMHPGIEARDFASDVERYIEKIAVDAIGAFVAGALAG